MTNLQPVKVVTPRSSSNMRTAAVFSDSGLFVVHFRYDGKRTRSTSGNPYEYRTKDAEAALATARQFVAYGERQ